ncbi:hypothetical protein L218DRAFT_998719 [Marasmius fiardii PR-910]|nr:hypothetical protein L218DRAFT_998719 [Marasmius fiardii PR-910]
MSEFQSLGFPRPSFHNLLPSDYTTSVADRYANNAVLKASYAWLAYAQDIPLAIRFALSQNPPLEFAIKGGDVSPHTALSSDGGLVIDLTSKRSADDKRSVSVGGALWSDVHTETDKHGVVPIGGNVHFLSPSPEDNSHLLGKIRSFLADGRIVTRYLLGYPR